MRKTVGIISGSLAPFLLALPAFAQGATDTQRKVVTCPEGQFNVLCRLTTENIGSVIGQIVTFIFAISLIIALLWLIYGGIKWMTSGGDKSAVEESRNHVVAALVGLVIIFLSFFVLNIITNFFFGTNITNIQIPTLQRVQ